MKDISKKIKTLRTATAEAMLQVSPKTILCIKEGTVPKGNPLEVSKIAAIQAAKNTTQLIPYCHNIPIDFVNVDFILNEDSIYVTVTVKAIHKTGVEMEALTACSIAVLTIYDMLKMLDESMIISNIKLVEKKGGKSDFKEIYKIPIKSAVLVASDSISQGKKEDLSGKIIVERLKEQGVEVTDYKIVSDDMDEIEKTLLDYCDKKKIDLVMTTGGTGFGPRDSMPEVMNKLIEREAPGISEAMRSYGQDRTPYAMLSRGKTGIRGKTIIINLPGSRGGVKESMAAIFPGVLHTFGTLWGGGHPSKEKEGLTTGR